ncbi:MAG: winged helix-turn-helix domain-containing protein [Halobacteria archaeon]
MKNLLWWLIIGSRGGLVRAEILKALKEHPHTAAQLAERLHLDYTTVRYHLRIMGENNVVSGAGKKYGETYALTQTMEFHWPLFLEILAKLGKEAAAPPAAPAAGAPGGGGGASGEKVHSPPPASPPEGGNPP